MRHPFLRTLAGATAAAPTDPNFKNVTLLLHGDGTNGGQNNTFVDGSTNNFTITRNGNTTQGTFSPYGDNWSVAVNGSSAYLTSANNANLAIGNSDFTFECWANGNSFSTDWSTFLGRWQGNGNYGYFFAYDTDGGLTFIYSTTGQGAGNVVRAYGGTMTVGRWHHLAICRSAGTTRAFIDGVQVGTATSDNVTIYNNNGPQTIGGVIDGVTIYHPFNGYVSNLRLVIGTALYTSNFTPSTTPLTAITNTRILACASNRFVDKSTTGLTLTPTGSPSVQRFSPFSPTAAYAAGTIGGSGYFDGTGDYLSRTVTSTTDGMYPQGTTWTLEAWVYPISTTGLILVYSIAATNVAFFGSCWLGLDSGAARFDIRTATGSGTPAVSISGGTVVIRAWNHLAISVSSGSAKLWLNGSQVGSTTSINALTFTPVAAGVGRFGNGYTSGINDYSGYISDVRIIQSTAQYTAAFTPPTAPLTAITNTSLLLNFTNAAILDNAMMVDLETAGNSQISTSVKKYGTGSLAFDGTGDYLSAPLNQGYVFGTGDFTVEYWLYPISNTIGCMVDLRTGESGNGAVAYSDYFTATGKLGLYINAATYTSTSTVPTGQWTHIAVARSGNSLRVFFNGVQDGSTVANSQNLMGGKLTVGANVALTGALNGYLDDVRITKGVARYTSNFAPGPTAALPDL